MLALVTDIDGLAASIGAPPAPFVVTTYTPALDIGTALFWLVKRRGRKRLA